MRLEYFSMCCIFSKGFLWTTWKYNLSILIFYYLQYVLIVWVAYFNVEILISWLCMGIHLVDMSFFFYILRFPLWRQRFKKGNEKKKNKFWCLVIIFLVFHIFYLFFQFFSIIHRIFNRIAVFRQWMSLLLLLFR